MASKIMSNKNIIKCCNTWKRVNATCRNMNADELKTQLWTRYAQLTDSDPAPSTTNGPTQQECETEDATSLMAAKDPIFFVCILAIAFHVKLY